MPEQRIDFGNYFKNLVIALQQLRDAHDSNFRFNTVWRLLEVDFQTYDHETLSLTFEVLSRHSIDDDCLVHVLLVDPAADSGTMSIGCTGDECARSRRGCIHTYAVVQNLLSRINQPNDEIRLLIQAGDGPLESPLFNKLDKLLDLQSRLVESEAAGAPTDRRLVWRVMAHKSIYSGGVTVDVAPYQQLLKKDNINWRKGTKLTLESLAYSDLLDGPQDEAVKSYLVQNPPQYRYGMSFGTGRPAVEILERLAGSSRVFFSNGQDDFPIEVLRGELGLKCEIDGDCLTVHPLCSGRKVEVQRFISVCDRSRLLVIGNETIQVIQAKTDAFRDFAFDLLKKPVTLPLAQASDLIARLAQLSVTLPIELPEQLVVSDVVADDRTYLELIPTKPSGLIARLRVRPVESMPSTLPGDRRLPTHLVDGDKVHRLCRHVDAEVARASALATELNLRRFSPLTDWDYRLIDDEQIIDFVGEVTERQHRKRGEEAATQTANTLSTTMIVESPSTGLVPISAAPTAFGVIPETNDLKVIWPQGGEMRVTSEINPSALQLAVEENEDWFGLSGMIHVDGHKLPLIDLLRAMKAGRRVVSLGQGLFARISDEFYDQLLAIGDVVHQTSKGLEVDITAAPVLSQLVDIKESLQLCESWQKMLSSLDPSEAVTLEPPISLSADLREYQLDGYRWMKRLSNWGVGGCLADDMGLGKTVQALALLLNRIEEGPTLVIAPMSVGFNWQREAQRFAPSLNVLAYRDSNRNEVLKEIGEGDVVIVSYALFQRDAEKFWDVEWGTLVLDEAQNVKNAATKTARAVRDLKAKWRLALTGTPIENQLSELWALFRAISPGLFGSWERFRERFVTPIEKSNDSRRRYALARMVKPFILRRTKNDVLTELPPRTEIQTTVELSDEERALYEAARVRIVAELMGLDFENSKDNRFQVLAGITKLRQLACHPRLCDKKWKKSSAKLDALLELVDELRGEQHRALVFSQFTSHLSIVRDAFDDAGISYQYLDGGSTAKQREAAVDAFQSGQGDVFLISLKAGGTGLNLTAADYVIHLDPWWNPAVEDQATDRAHRYGQTRPVTVYRLVAKDTIEEKIIALHDRKRELVSSILEGSDEAAKLSTQELVDLIKTSGSTAYQPGEDVVEPVKPRRGRPKKVSFAE